ncbi:aldehyde dehydrogenase [Terribacillus saccharophilus]|uniref:Aldehyde dehydrogenase n=1 Tax=Terribacillus saccharophilus TaxID=361277 RepID=A0ABX4GTQ9_9BACI|nr:aldehyde dehydrogenase [Terribacillus saccharophilus]PAD33709.1 aldehyde dehydrogenase [Terribacillus saccharophilus]PAD94520.1 aldehyde dehydrogenase [Terribacillus saccharophilus]PAD98250.1 aldehyde dehydrogenase [Terribacillus saccharophilus]
METHKLYINGRFMTSQTEETIDILNPATEEVISKIPKSTEDEVNQAVDGAAAAQKEWEQTPAIERAKIVRQLGDELEKRKDTFVSLLQEEQGKNYELATGEVDMAIDFFRYTSEWARRIEGDIVPSDRPNENIFIYKKPIGVVAGIVPWNFPVFILARKVAQALTAGCTLVLKPSQQTPNTAYEFTKMVDELGIIPDGVYQYVTGTGSALGNQLASHPKVDMISITGSVTAGTKVMEAAAQNITKVNLELGGKAPAIVTANADLDLAVEQIKASRLLNNGQTCTNAERVYVHESVAETFTEKLKQSFEGVSYGDPAKDHNVELGPLVSKDRLETVEEMVAAAKEEGANCIIGGKRPDAESGYFYEPTILTNVQHDSSIIKDEIFGPVVPVVTFTNLEEAIEMGNDTDYGLSSSIYTENLNEAMKVINELKFGETYVNRENMEAVQGYHAGIRKSGLGGTDGKYGIEDFLITQAVYMQYKK